MDRLRQVDALLSTYPRHRPELPWKQQASYVEHYRSNRAGKQGLARSVLKLESWMHRRVAEGVIGGTLLEIGAGNLNHVPYLPGTCICDAVEPFRSFGRIAPTVRGFAISIPISRKSHETWITTVFSPLPSWST